LKGRERRVGISLDSIRESEPGVLRDSSLGALERLAILARYEPGESIYRCNDWVEHWYRIVGGAARKSVVSGDGRRHIVDFVFPGDMFGFGVFRSRQFCVEAIASGTVVARYPRRSVERLADYDPQIARIIREAAFDSIARLQRRMVTLGRTSALEKVSAFLLEMSDRSLTPPIEAVFLPMSRYDIADYLAMAVETVSRTLTALRCRHTIAFRSVRQVHICDRRALEQFAGRLTGVISHRSAVVRARSACEASFD
jgi:CRP/FNR family transcriptional regulator, nitrogen fixation regulation protein